MSKEIGTLVVVVLKARNLRDKHTIHKQDVYAQATLNKNTKKTAVDKRGGQHPVWDEELRFPIVKAQSEETRKLEISCFSKEARQDELVGRGTVDISETLKTGEFDDWVTLDTEDGGSRGEIFLEMTFYAAVPPLQRRPSKWSPADRLQRPNSNYQSPPSQGLPKPNGRPTSSPGKKQNLLPPLPEEASALAPASSPKIPSSLLPGAGVKRNSPTSSTGLLPPEYPLHTQTSLTPPRDPSPPAPTHGHQSSFDSIPPYLRPGGGTRPPSQPPLQPPPHTPTPVSQPLESIPPYLQPGAAASRPPLFSRPSIPEPQIPTPSIPSYGTPAVPLQPQHISSPPPQPQPYGSLPSPYSLSGFSSPPPPQQYPPCSSPPRAYTPLSALPPTQDYPPYGGGSPQPPQPYHAQSYPSYGGYPALSNTPIPPPAPIPTPGPGPDLPDPYLERRYQSPFPLPDGGRTPAPSHPMPQPTPQPHVYAPSQPQLQPTPGPVRNAATRPAHSRGPSREERDRNLALELLEKEEDERRRGLREQEERDMELARQLDMELNLEQDRNGARGTLPGRGGGGIGGGGRAEVRTGATAMPGGW